MTRSATERMLTNIRRVRRIKIKEIIDSGEAIQNRLGEAQPYLERILKSDPILQTLFKSLIEDSGKVTRVAQELYSQHSEQSEELSSVRDQLKAAQEQARQQTEKAQEIQYDLIGAEQMAIADEVYLQVEVPTILKAHTMFDLGPYEEALVELKKSNPERFNALEAIWGRVKATP